MGQVDSDRIIYYIMKHNNFQLKLSKASDVLLKNMRFGIGARFTFSSLTCILTVLFW